MSNSKKKQLPAQSSRSEFLIYKTDDGRVKLDVRLENETIWLTQQMMANLFQSTKQNIGQHLKNIFVEGELDRDSVVKEFFTTAADGKQYKTNLYNLDAIISVGCHHRQELFAGKGDRGTKPEWHLVKPSRDECGGGPRPYRI